MNRLSEPEGAMVGVEGWDVVMVVVGVWMGVWEGVMVWAVVRVGLMVRVRVAET